MCQFAFQTTVTNRWLVQIALIEGLFILSSYSWKYKERVNWGNRGGTFRSFRQFWLCLACRSAQSCSLPEALAVKHVNGLGPERASLAHSLEFAVKPHKAGRAPKYKSFPACSGWAYDVDGMWRESMSICSCMPVISSKMHQIKISHVSVCRSAVIIFQRHKI